MDAEGSPLEPYRDAVRRFGAGFDALLWNSVESQEWRFAQLTGEVDLSGSVLADMGCGRADLLGFLDRRGVARNAYIGIEGLGELAAAARQQIEEWGSEDASILEADFACDEGLFDTLVCDHGVGVIYFSGSLNTFEPDAARAVLARAWAAIGAVEGGVLAFNFLSDSREASARDKPARRWDTTDNIRWALSETWDVVFRQGYLRDNDATIVMRSLARGG